MGAMGTGKSGGGCLAEVMSGIAGVLHCYIVTAGAVVIIHCIQHLNLLLKIGKKYFLLSSRRLSDLHITRSVAYCNHRILHELHIKKN